MPRQPTSPFIPQERDLIRLELMPRFGQEPKLANGLFLRTWRGGPQKGKPKIPKAMQGMLDRGLLEIRTNPMDRQAAFFTEAGLAALRLLLEDRRAMDTERLTTCGGRISKGVPMVRPGTPSDYAAAISRVALIGSLKEGLNKPHFCRP